jgi:hypothetical protein
MEYLAREAQQQQAERERAGRREAKKSEEFAVHGLNIARQAGTSS